MNRRKKPLTPCRPVSESADNIPVVLARHVGPHLVIACPSCGRTVLHGAGKPGRRPAYGHRENDCFPCGAAGRNRRGYFLVPPEAKDCPVMAYVAELCRHIRVSMLIS